MTSPPGRDRAETVRQLLHDHPPEVHYDTARGLARHEQLIASGAAVPEWGRDIGPMPTRGAWLAKRGLWWVGSLTLLCALVLSVRGGAPTTPHTMPDAAAPVVEAVQPGLATQRIAAQPRGHASAPNEESTAGRPGRQSGQVAGTDVAPSTIPPTERGVASADFHPASAGGVLTDGPATTNAEARVAEDHDRVGSRTEPSEATPRDVRAKVVDVASGLPAEASNPTLDTTREGATRGVRGARGAASKARSRVASEAPRDAEEMRQLSQAELLLAPEPVRALRIVREGHLQFRDGYFAQERRYIEVMALFALGRYGEAHAHAAWFLRDYPTGPYRHKVEGEALRHPVH